ncbi:hypothetical protein [uncultured Pseudokineococcus sp.]|uniref:hypothetical protein n=1 Tax=uncultured Pseudokineococcus sp. TaxID=1642928 RepID=UPI002609EB62|nr:hypothetical protein [uncultured Pseudokineococcus sp.]
MGDGALWALVLSGLAVGAVSSVVPVLAVEAYVVAVAAVQPGGVGVAVALAAALGQSAGKGAIFVAVRSAGRSRWSRRLHRHALEAMGRAGQTAPAAADGGPWARAGRLLRRLTAWCLRVLSGPWGAAVVLLSGVAGVPPLLVVSAAAGASRLPLGVFLAACLAGRAVRLVALALVPDLLGVVP